MKTDKKTLAALIVSAALLVCAAALAIFELLAPAPEAMAGPPEESDSVTIELFAVGDNLMHGPLIKSGLGAEGYNFDGFYEHILPQLEGMDIKAINQETVFVSPDMGYTGYPTFGGPAEVGDALVKAGFNVIEQASNHSYDKREEGLRFTMDYWRSQPVTLLGVNSSAEDALRVDKFTKDGFTVALANYTYSLNGLAPPQGEEYLVNMMDDEARPAIAEQLARAKAESDLLVVFPHWGTEYDTEPDDFQRDWLKFFNENGADVIIGAHPHVLQTAEEYIGENGHKTVVFYSLGNFISNQDTLAKELGGMARVTLVKDDFGARVRDFSLEPCFTHVSGGKYTVYPLEDYTDELARTHSKLGGLTVQAIYDEFYRITGFETGKFRPERTPLTQPPAEERNIE